MVDVGLPAVRLLFCQQIVGIKKSRRQWCAAALNLNYVKLPKHRRTKPSYITTVSGTADADIESYLLRHKRLSVVYR
jgi:hypothetical protein